MIRKLEYWFRHYIAYPILRRIFFNPEINSSININSVKSVLILRYDRIGDMIVTTPIFKALKAANPNLRIGVLASKANAEIIQHNKNVDVIHVLPTRWWKILDEIIKARKEQYNLVLNLVFNRTTSGGVLANLIAPNGIKIGQGDKKYGFFFNKLLQLIRKDEHMVETLAFIIKEVFDIKLAPDQLKYEITINAKTKERINEYLVKHNLRPRYISDANKSPYIVFNLSAYDGVRRISGEQASLLGEYLGSNTTFRTLLIHAPNDNFMLSIKKQLTEKSRCLPFPDEGNASLLELAALIESAIAVITPDTSIIHFASAKNTPVLGFYTAIQDVHEWLPYNVEYNIVISDNKSPASSIPVPVMIDAIDEFIFELDIQHSPS